MNLLDLALGAVSVLNPMQTVTVTYLNGYTTNPDGSRVPNMATMLATAQVQPLATGELAMVEAMQIQGVHKKFYLDGSVNGLVRVAEIGGTLITTADGLIWKVTDVPESWQDAGPTPSWTCAIATLQNGS